MESIKDYRRLGKDFGNDLRKSCPHINTDLTYSRPQFKGLLLQDFNDLFLSMTINDFQEIPRINVTD